VAARLEAGAAVGLRTARRTYAKLIAHFSMNTSGFYSDIEAIGPSTSHILGEEQSSGSIKLKICGRRLLVAVAGEPPGHLWLAPFQEGVARNLLFPGMRTLVDMTRFRGVVEWQAIAKLRKLAPWGTEADHPSRIAYLLREQGAAILIKAAGALFPGTEHRGFTEHRTAVEWLER